MTAQVAQYVGIAATTSQEEVTRLQEMLAELDWPEAIKLMNGPLVSRKTLRGLQPDNPAQYPPMQQVDHLLVDDGRVFNVIHFNSRDPRLANQLDAIVRFAPHTQAIQLNIMWPNYHALATYRDSNSPYLDRPLTLQISKQAYEAIGARPADLVDCLRPYEGIAEYVLFDPSGGTGTPYDRREAVEVLSALVDSGLGFSWGVTGGLSADRVYGLRELLEIYPQLSWDAQSRLRTGDERDKLDLEKCYAFLAASMALLDRCR